MTFNPVEAQQHIKWYGSQVSAIATKTLASDLESAVEYIERKVALATANHMRVLELEVEVERLKAGMNRAVRVEDSMTHQPFHVIVGRMIRILNDALTPAPTEPEREN